MNEQALNDAYQLFTGAGYTGSKDNFLTLINSNEQALDDAFNLFSGAGYKKSKQDFSNLLGLGKQTDSTEDPTVSPNTMGSQLGNGSSESVSWFDQTWFGRGYKAASTTGEATDLMTQDFSNIDIETIQEFIKAKEDEARNYAPSESMQKFQKKYKEEGETWSAFFRGVREQPGLLPELFVQSLGTQIGTLADSPGATLAAAGTGAAVGAVAGPAGILAGAFGGLATSMEAALTFGELIETRLKEKNLEFTDENVMDLLEEEGDSIRNKAIGRGMSIGVIEGLSGGLAGKTALAARKAVTGTRRGLLAAGAAGAGVEALGGATGEIAGRVAAGQDMDPAEIGFEAITGTVTAPLNVSAALLTAKKPTYMLNKEEVTYEQMKKFVDTADDLDIAKADIKIENDFTGVGETAAAKQEAAIKGIELTGEQEIIADVAKTRRDIAVSDTINLLKEGKKIKNVKDAFSVENNEEAANAFKKLQDQYGKDLIPDKDVTDADGFFVPTPDGNVVIVNKDVAGKKGQINVGGHELLHAITSNYYNGLDLAGKTKFIGDFKNTLSKNSFNYIKNIINERNKGDENLDLETTDEWLNIYSDGIIKEEISYDESAFTKFRNILHNIFRTFGYKKEFGSGIATYNFMRDYNTTIKNSNKISQRALRVAGDEAVVGETKLSRTNISQAAEFVDKIEEKLRTRLKTEGKDYTKEEFQQSEEFNRIFRSINLENGFVNNYIKSLGMSNAKRLKTIEEINKRILGYDPQAKRKAIDPKTDKVSEKPVTIGERIMSDAQFAKLDAARDLAIEGKTEGKTVRIDAAKRTEEGETTFDIEDTTVDTQQEALETEDISPQAEARRAQQKVKPKVSEFRNKVGFKTGGKIYNEILDNAKKSLIRAYGKTQDIKDAAARERAVVEQIQKEHNSLNSPLFKQVKNWLTYGVPEETVPKGTKDIYFQNLIDFREDIAKLISTSDLVQIERLINESDRIFTVYKETLRKKADVQKAVDNRQLPPDAIRKFDKDKKINVYDKVIPSETQIVAFANQPAKIPAKDKKGTPIIKNGEALMIRSGLKGTRKDGVTKNIVNGLVFDATMEARQSKEVIDRVNLLDVDVTSVAQLSAATGRPTDVKFSKTIGKNNIDAFIKELNSVGLTKQHATNFGKDNRQRRLAATALNTLIKEVDNEGTYSSLTPMLVEMQELINKGLSFNEIVNTTFNNHKHLFEGVESNLYASFFEGGFSKNHVTGILGLAKRITEAQINGIAFNDAIADLAQNNSDKNIKNFLRQYSKQIRTAKFKYKGKTITKNEHVLEFIINDVKPNNKFGLVDVPKGQRITFNNVEQRTYQNSTETKEVFKNNKEVSEALETNNKESKEAIDFTISIVESNKSTEVKKALIKSLFADTDAAGRKIALFGIMSNNESRTVLDHRPPINKVIEKIYETIDNPTKQNISDLKTFLQNTRVNNMPADVDVLLTKLGYKTEGGMEVMENVEVINLMEGVKTTSYNGAKFSKTSRLKPFGDAVNFSRSAKNATKGISILDFDDTLATTESLVKFTRPDSATGTLNAEQYASTYESLLDQGYTFDFSDFNKVVKGKLAPLFQKALKLQNKFGPENMFVLTARPPAAQKAIFDFLKANGLNIPLKNITGLGNSTAEAKALWVADKVTDGYNDFYFADDALQNVQAVKNMLEQFDVKSKVQQAKVKFSKSMSKEFNDILQDVTGIETQKRFSEAKARKRGQGKGRFRLFIPPSHEDFIGLLYNFIGEGEKGNKHRDFFEKALIQPLNRAYRELSIAKQTIANDYRNLTKQMPDIRKKLTQSTPDGDFTYDDAVRVYLWNKFGFDIPGLTKTDTNKLIELVNLDNKLKMFADKIGLISKIDEGYVQPGEHWLSGNIKQDLADATGRVGRKKFFAEFIENSDQIFGKIVNGKLVGDNANKIRAAYGDNFVEALEDMLYASQSGTNRKQGGNKQVNAFLDYLNGSVGATMFFNARSAVLQTLSTVNFINFADNNIFKAAAAFADQPQFWKDFSMIFNSDYLKQRRAGVGFDVNGAEIAAAVKKSKEPVKAAIAYILNKGFLPTQMADSFAIALGGSSMYRNRVNTYIKQGLSKKEAEIKAFEDFQATAESTQQSARPDMLSQLQRSALGRMIFAFQNVTSQYARLIKKSTLDLIKRRKTPPYDTQVQSDMSNISKIIYYGAIQNFIFYSLQSALFAMSFEDDEDEDKKNEKFFKTKKQRLINGSIDSILRGSGLPGAVLAVVKNAVIKYGEQNEKGWGRKLGVISDELLQISPPVGIKIRKLDSFEKTMAFNQKVIPEMDTFDLDNPIWDAYGNLVEGATNVPVARLLRKVENVRSALNSENAWWQRLALALGWSKWELGIEDKEVKEVKERIKNTNKQVNKETKRRRTRTRTRTRTR